MAVWGGWLGKIDDPLDQRLAQVEWGEYSFASVFNNIRQGRRLKKDDQIEGNIPFVMSGTANTGVVGRISNPVVFFPSNSITVDIFGNVFYRDYEFGAGDDTGVYWSNVKEYTREQMMFIATAMRRALVGKFTFGNKLRSSQSLDIKMSLPIKECKINYEFMDEIIVELEKRRIKKIESYLSAKGIRDYHLSPEEDVALSEFSKHEWRGYRVGELFNIENTNSFDSDVLTEGTDFDYITRTSLNQGILRQTGFVNAENINSAGNWSLGLLQMDFFYREKPWYAGQFVRKVTPKLELNKEGVLFFTVILNKLKPLLLNVLVRNVDETFLNSTIVLPIHDETIDFAYMSVLIRAMEKLVIRDVVKYLEGKLSSARQVCAG